jgi:hypothetical protein
LSLNQIYLDLLSRQINLNLINNIHFISLCSTFTTAATVSITSHLIEIRIITYDLMSSNLVSITIEILSLGDYNTLNLTSKISLILIL